LTTGTYTNPLFVLHLFISVNSHVSSSLGKIAGHNIVMACLPDCAFGTTSATAVVSHIKSTFSNIQDGLIFGIAGGVPSDTANTTLGDVMVSKPTGTLGGVVQYDLGRAVGERQFQRTGRTITSDCSLDYSLGEGGIFND
jgi:hypothetical protein